MASNAPGMGPEVLEIDLPGGGPARIIPIPTDTASRVLASGRYLLYGWSLRETTGAAAASLDLYDGGGAGGTLAGSVGLASGGSSVAWFGENAILLEQGLYLDMLSGSVQGAFYVR